MRELYWLFLCGAFIAALFLSGCSESTPQPAHTYTAKEQAQDRADAEAIDAHSQVNNATITCKPFEGEDNKACLKEKLRVQYTQPSLYFYCNGHPCTPAEAQGH